MIMKHCPSLHCKPYLFSAREAEYETKIEDLLTRLQEQNALYLKLQAEFDSYEWWEEGDGAHEHSKDDKKRSRESIATRSRPPSRPPTREDFHRPTIANIINESTNDEEEEEEYEEAEEHNKSHQSRSVLETPSKEFFTTPNSPASSLGKEEDPEIPPRRGDKSEEASRSSWQEDASYST